MKLTEKISMRDRDHAHPSHPYRMYGAIHAQPSAIDRVLNGEGESMGRLARRAESAGRVHLVGIGTSWHAALVGENLLRTAGGLDNVRAWNSFEFNAYRPELGGRRSRDRTQSPWDKALFGSCACLGQVCRSCDRCSDRHRLRRGGGTLRT